MSFVVPWRLFALERDAQHVVGIAHLGDEDVCTVRVWHPSCRDQTTQQKGCEEQHPDLTRGRSAGHAAATSRVGLLWQSVPAWGGGIACISRLKRYVRAFPRYLGKPAREVGSG